MRLNKITLIISTLMFIGLSGAVYAYYNTNLIKKQVSKQEITTNTGSIGLSNNTSDQTIVVGGASNLPNLCITSCNAVQHSNARTAPSTQTSQSLSQPVSQKTSSSCSSLFSTYYTIPMQSIKPAPTSSYLIHYIGTADYDYQVNLYNFNVATYNSKWQQYKSNFLNEANQVGCSTGLYISMMALDEAYPYTAN
jgi:hypothetical protein